MSIDIFGLFPLNFRDILEAFLEILGRQRYIFPPIQETLATVPQTGGRGRVR